MNANSSFHLVFNLLTGSFFGFFVQPDLRGLMIGVGQVKPGASTPANAIETCLSPLKTNRPLSHG
jgi:vacuolar-type H+-ATPase subunit I/STV1